MRPISSTAPTTTPSSSSSMSTWHSPVPYLFGGLAAMLGLIAFALFILACSFWKLTAVQSNDHEEEEQQRQRTSMERNLATKETDEGTNKEQVKPYEDKILVIMAGHHKPTFLATPTSATSSSSPNQGPRTNINSAKHILKEDKTQKEIMDNNHHHNNNVEHQQQQQPETQQSQ